MKIFILECSEEELKMNRGILDNIVDACTGFLNTLYGSHIPTSSENDKEDEDNGECCMRGDCE